MRPEGHRRLAVLIFEKTYRATLDALSDGFGCQAAEIWSFDDAQSRRAAELRLAAQGARVTCRSALKPLVCAFREEIPTISLERAEIVYPRHPAAHPERFLREAYPLTGMFPDVDFRLVPGPKSTEMPAYRLRLIYAGGKERRLSVLAPNANQQGELSPCGWMICDGVGARLSTSYEAIYHDAMAAIRGADFPSIPCFEELNIAVTLPSPDEALGWGNEVLSLCEALHEELYFGILEHFQQRFGLPAGDRSLRPGQIVPEIRVGSECSLRIELRPWDPVTPAAPGPQPLGGAVSALAADQIAQELARIPGEVFAGRSVIGRPIEGRYRRGSDRPVMITAGQHANEISGPIGALRAGQELAQLARAHFTLCPLENPDGYALRQRLAQHGPHHMLHAARYTALGDDLEYREAPPLAERGMRDLAHELSGAQLHINLHGYPAHEWLRPLTGYLPRGFADWTLPRGFLLILRHHPGWAATARRLAEGIAARLEQQPALVEFNAMQMAMAARHAVAPGEIIGGFACHLTEDCRAPMPLTLITEYPDETLSGAALIAAHDAQTAAVIAAYEAFQALEVLDWNVG